MTLLPDPNLIQYPVFCSIPDPILKKPFPLGTKSKKKEYDPKNLYRSSWEVACSLVPLLRNMTAPLLETPVSSTAKATKMRKEDVHKQSAHRPASTKSVFSEQVCSSVHRANVQRCVPVHTKVSTGVHQSAHFRVQPSVQQCAPVARRVPVINLSDPGGPRWTGQMLTVAPCLK